MALFRYGILAIVLLANSLHAQRNLKDIPDTDPEIERKSFILADGFEVNLFAADPQIAKPIHMNFDEKGRLWIAGSSVYPHIEPGQSANDKILILEDTNGDGKSDKTTVFADGLLIPTGRGPSSGWLLRGKQHRADPFDRYRWRRQSRFAKKLSCQDLAPKIPTISCTRCGGGMTVACT